MGPRQYVQLMEVIKSAEEFLVTILCARIGTIRKLSEAFPGRRNFFELHTWP